MGRYDNTARNQYNSTPRKVFDAYIDRMAVKRARDKEDHRADVQALLKRISNLENQLTHQRQLHDELQVHVDAHCDRDDFNEEHKDA